MIHSEILASFCFVSQCCFYFCRHTVWLKMSKEIFRLCSALFDQWTVTAQKHGHHLFLRALFFFFFFFFFCCYFTFDDMFFLHLLPVPAWRIMRLVAALTYVMASKQRAEIGGGGGVKKEEGGSRRMMSSCCCTAAFIDTLHLLASCHMLLCILRSIYAISFYVQ